MALDEVLPGTFSPRGGFTMAEVMVGCAHRERHCVWYKRQHCRVRGVQFVQDSKDLRSRRSLSSIANMGPFHSWARAIAARKNGDSMVKELQRS